MVSPYTCYSAPMELPVDLPDDVEVLKALVLASQVKLAEQKAMLADRDAVINSKKDRIATLEKRVLDFKRALFGTKSEKSDPD